MEIKNRTEMLLEEILKWQRFSCLSSLKEILKSNLPADEDKLIFELSDGILSTRDLAKKLNLKDHKIIWRRWQKWSVLGILQESKKYAGRYEKICSLREIGFEVPKSLQKNNLVAEEENLEKEEGLAPVVEQNLIQGEKIQNE